MTTTEKMTPAEIRDYDFAQLRARLPEMCVRVYAAFDKYGPGTTRDVAERSGIALLTLRPRACELVADGWLECVGREGHEGVYRSLTPVERQALGLAFVPPGSHRREQMELPLAEGLKRNAQNALQRVGLREDRTAGSKASDQSAGLRGG